MHVPKRATNGRALNISSRHMGLMDSPFRVLTRKRAAISLAYFNLLVPWLWLLAIFSQTETNCLLLLVSKRMKLAHVQVNDFMATLSAVCFSAAVSGSQSPVCMAHSDSDAFRPLYRRRSHHRPPIRAVFSQLSLSELIDEGILVTHRSRCFEAAQNQSVGPVQRHAKRLT